MKQSNKSEGPNLVALLSVLGALAILTAAITSPFEARAGFIGLAPDPEQKDLQLNQMHPEFVISPTEATEWHAFKDKGGPTFSGSDSWKSYIGFVEKKLKEYGAVDITHNAFTYDRWHTTEWPDESGWSLVSNGKPIKVSSYGAYSGATPAAGTTAELIYYDPASPPKNIAGRIVVWQPEYSEADVDALATLDYERPAIQDSYPKSGQPVPGNVHEVGSMIWSQIPQVGGFIRTLVQGKAAGAVFVFNATSDQMAGLYTFPCPQLYDAPSLYLDREAGNQVIADAKAGAKATIRLRAEVTPAETWQLISYLPGKNYGTAQDELILFSTHTDGPSISQEDGALGFLAIARYYSHVPQSSRPRTLMFFMDNRHYMPGGERRFAEQDWFARHSEVRDRVVGVIGMEHLGQIEFVEQGSHLRPSGRIDQSNLWVTNNSRMISMAEKAIKDNQLKGAFVRCPGKPGVNGRNQGPWYGLGGVANRIGKPGFATMGSMGVYWSTSSRLDRFDAPLFCRQIATFSQLTGELMVADLRDIQTAQSTPPAASGSANH